MIPLGLFWTSFLIKKKKITSMESPPWSREGGILYHHFKPGIHLRQRQAKARHVPFILRVGRGIPRVCLTLIYRHVMALIAAASEACGSARCAVYASWGEAVMLRLGLSLPQVYSRLYGVVLRHSTHYYSPSHHRGQGFLHCNSNLRLINWRKIRLIWKFYWKSK